MSMSVCLSVWSVCPRGVGVGKCLANVSCFLVLMSESWHKGVLSCGGRRKDEASG